MKNTAAKHTPGPWEVEVFNGLHINSWNGKRLAEVVSDSMTPYEKAKQNAKLIAAAPELLAQVKSMLLFIETYGGEVTQNYSAAIPGVKELIAKAEGRE